MAITVIHFQISYKCHLQEVLIIQTSSHNEDIILSSQDGEHWHGVMLVESSTKLKYRYVIKRQQVIEPEDLGWRRMIVPKNQTFIQDFWRTRKHRGAIFLSDPFTKVWGQKIKNKEAQAPEVGHIRFSLHEGHIRSGEKLSIIGNAIELGSWANAISMEAQGEGIWVVDVPFSPGMKMLEYKYVITDENNNIRYWEEEDNRKLTFSHNENIAWLVNDEYFNRSTYDWKLSGVAIPVFSLRSDKSCGIGEFADLKLLIDFASKTGMQMVQILPVNDTLARLTWRDSYPYAAISVQALHPLYINVAALGAFPTKRLESRYRKDLSQLNANEVVDFEAVLVSKIHYFKAFFNKYFASCQDEEDYKAFVSSNKEWLRPYAVFCALRDRYQTADFNSWDTLSVFSQQEMETVLGDDADLSQQADFYTYLQYHAHLQLSEVKTYGKSKGVVLKGDLPIGIYRHSADAWTQPKLYHMDQQAGAPPDAYAVDGQNWGFPTYNWQVMAQDGYFWWQKRMIKLAEYFDALRVDHILGFFRIWQIPLNQQSGTLGLFNPRLPLHREDMSQRGLYVDYYLWSIPELDEGDLANWFGDHTDIICNVFFEKMTSGYWTFKPQFKCQQDILDYIALRTELQVYETILLT